MCSDSGIPTNAIQTTTYTTTVDPMVVTGSNAYYDGGSSMFYATDGMSDPHLTYVGTVSTSVAEQINASFLEKAFQVIENFVTGTSALDAQDAATTFDPTGKTRVVIWDSQGQTHPGFKDNSDGSIWYDANKNGTPETHAQYFQNPTSNALELWSDNNFDGVYEHYIGDVLAGYQ